MQRFWLQAMVIIGAGLVTGLIFSLRTHLPPPVKIVDNTGRQGSPARPEQPGTPAPTGKVEPAAAAPVDGADLISVEAAKTLYDGHNAVFIDARPKAEFLQSHVTGAMQLEKSDLDGPPPSKVLNYLPGMEVVVYCHGELCTDSANVVKRLLALNKGIGPMHIIKAGFPGWQAAKLPVESGPEAGFQ